MPKIGNKKQILCYTNTERKKIQNFKPKKDKNENIEENLNKKKSNSCQYIKENIKILNLIKNPNLIYGAGNEFTINVNKGENQNYDILEIDN